MNPLTQVKNTQKATRREIEAGISESASWHAKFKHSAYIFTGGLDYDLTEGDLLAVFAQYGEVVDMNLVRDTDSGKSKGFAFLAYEDQRSTVLAVDNLNGAKVAGRTIRVEHVDNYKKRKAELDGEEYKDEEEEAPAAQAGGPDRSRSPPAAAAGGRPGAVKQEPANNAAPWAAAGSIFSLLQEARQREKAPDAKGGAWDAGRNSQEHGTHGQHRGSFGPPRPPPRPNSRPQDDRERGRGDDTHRYTGNGALQQNVNSQAVRQHEHARDDRPSTSGRERDWVDAARHEGTGRGRHTDDYAQPRNRERDGPYGDDRNVDRDRDRGREYDEAPRHASGSGREADAKYSRHPDEGHELDRDRDGKRRERESSRRDRRRSRSRSR